MRNYAFDIFQYCKGVIPHYLQKIGDALIWQTMEGLNWITEGGFAWTTGTPSRHLDWIQSLLAPLQVLNATFAAYVNNTRYLLYLTGQVIYLEHYLNDLFDPTLRRIYIDDGALVLPPYLYNKDDFPVYDPLQPHPVFPPGVWFLYNKADDEQIFYLNNKQDFASNGWFIVFVPAAIPLTSSLIDQIKRAVNRYKQAGPTYLIQSF